MRRLINPTNSAFLFPVVLLFAFLAVTFTYSASASAQSTGKLCSGANLDLGGDKRSCVSADGTPLNDGGKFCKDADNKNINCSDNTLNNLVAQVVNVFSIIVGVVAVIMMIYAGFRYITSGGDSGKVGESKNTLIYAIVGLIIVALAQFIVKFILEKISKA